MQDLEKGYDTLHVRIDRVDMVWCYILTDGSFEFIYPPYLCFCTINRPKEVFIAAENLVTPDPPYPLVWVKEVTGGIILSNYWLICLRIL